MVMRRAPTITRRPTLAVHPRMTFSIHRNFGLLGAEPTLRWILNRIALPWSPPAQTRSTRCVGSQGAPPRNSQRDTPKSNQCRECSEHHSSNLGTNGEQESRRVRSPVCQPSEAQRQKRDLGPSLSTMQSRRIQSRRRLSQPNSLQVSQGCHEDLSNTEALSASTMAT